MADTIVAPPPAAAPVSPAPATGSPDPNASLSDLVRAAGEQAQSEVAGPSAEVAPADASQPPAQHAGAEGGQPQVTPESAPPEDDFSVPEEVSPDSQSQDGSTHYYNASKSRRLQAANKLVNSIQEFMPVVTVDAIKEAVQKSNAADAMMQAYRMQGDFNLPMEDRMAAMNDMLGMFKADGVESYGMMALRMAADLRTVNPPAYKELTRFHDNRVINEQIAKISQITDPALREKQAVFVQNLQMSLLGKFSRKEDLLKSQQVDPLQARESDLQRREREVQESENARRQEAYNLKLNNIHRQEDAAVLSEVDAVLNTVKNNFPAEDIDAMRQKFIGSIIPDAERAKEEWAIRYRSLYSEAVRTGSETDIRNLTDFRKSVARAIVRANAQRVINSKTASTLASNPPPNGVQGRTELSPNGAPVQHGGDGLLKATQATNWGDTWKNIWQK